MAVMTPRGHGRKVRTGLAMAALVASSVLSSCGSSATTKSANQKLTVLVDYNNDEVAVSAFAYFPKKVEARPGDTVEFKQAWTGEPHSVTLGSMVDRKIQPIIGLLNKVIDTGEFPKGDGEPEEFKQFDLPYTFGEGDTLAQNAARPCFVDKASFEGTYPGDDKTPCPKKTQPEFSGQPIYNSGVIPFEGVGGNTFNVKLADDIKPGTYSYYCNVHGPLQYGQIEVKPKGTEIPSRSAVAKQARAEAERWSAPMLANYKAALAGKEVVGGEPDKDEKVEAKGKNLVGIPTPFFKDKAFIHGIVDEFVPGTVKGKVGVPITWTFSGSHTLSFNVPKYFPVFTVAKNGNVKLNPKAGPAIGWPEPPKPPDAAADHNGPPEPKDVKVEWDGKGFHSTGMGYSGFDKFSITFTKPGTYPYACLIHPQMVGKVVVGS